MRIKIDLELPPWTKWLVCDVAIGLVLGVGASRVYADTVTVKTWAPGDKLTAVDINANFKACKMRSISLEMIARNRSVLTVQSLVESAVMLRGWVQ